MRGAGDLAGRRVVVAVTGSVAAYKAAGLVSRLRQAGADVRVVMTEAAARLVAPATFEALSGHAVHRDLFAPGEALVHVRLADEADAVVVAPATADVIARAAAGMADDAVTAVLLAAGRRVPVIMAPAMNSHMWENELVQRNVATLKAVGVLFVGPVYGRLAEGYEGMGRMAEEDEILGALSAALGAARGRASEGEGGSP